jgi:hypothetical protein
VLHAFCWESKTLFIVRRPSNARAADRIGLQHIFAGPFRSQAIPGAGGSTHPPLVAAGPRAGVAAIPTPRSVGMERISTPELERDLAMYDAEYNAQFHQPGLVPEEPLLTAVDAAMGCATPRPHPHTPHRARARAPRPACPSSSRRMLTWCTRRGAGGSYSRDALLDMVTSFAADGAPDNSAGAARGSPGALTPVKSEGSSSSLNLSCSTSPKVRRSVRCRCALRSAPPPTPTGCHRHRRRRASG